MKIRNYLLVLALTFFSFGNFNQVIARENITKEEAQARGAQIRERVDEIRNMDLSTLTRTQKVELRHELKDMKKEMTESPVLIVISGGALILIIILLILLL